MTDFQHSLLCLLRGVFFPFPYGLVLSMSKIMLITRKNSVVADEPSNPSIPIPLQKSIPLAVLELNVCTQFCAHLLCVKVDVQPS